MYEHQIRLVTGVLLFMLVWLSLSPCALFFPSFFDTIGMVHFLFELSGHKIICPLATVTLPHASFSPLVSVGPNTKCVYPFSMR